MVRLSIDIDDKLDEPEIIIRCKNIDDRIIQIQKVIDRFNNDKLVITFYKEDKEYYLALSEIIFFETDGNDIYGHTVSETYLVKYRLNTLEKVLPDNFMRVSKSTIVNTNQIFSISYNITSSSLFQFYKSHKQVYASRFYVKDLKAKLKERRNV
jgi:DNA-binding LytR/AlgR family response regulator